MAKWIVRDYEDNVVPHAEYPHMGDGDLYDCPACEVIMAEEDPAEYDGPADRGYHSIENTSPYRVNLRKCDDPWLAPGHVFVPPF